MSKVDWVEHAAKRYGSDIAEDVGYAVLVGIERIKNVERACGDDGFGHHYVTHFPMPDCGEWEVTVRRKA